MGKKLTPVAAKKFLKTFHKLNNVNRNKPIFGKNLNDYKKDAYFNNPWGVDILPLYYYIGSNCKIELQRWHGFKSDMKLKKIGNFFLNKKDALPLQKKIYSLFIKNKQY